MKYINGSTHTLYTLALLLELLLHSSAPSDKGNAMKKINKNTMHFIEKSQQV